MLRRIEAPSAGFCHVACLEDEACQALATVAGAAPFNVTCVLAGGDGGTEALRHFVTERRALDYSVNLFRRAAVQAPLAASYGAFELQVRARASRLPLWQGYEAEPATQCSNWAELVLFQEGEGAASRGREAAAACLERCARLPECQTVAVRRLDGGSGSCASLGSGCRKAKAASWTLFSKRRPTSFEDEHLVNAALQALPRPSPGRVWAEFGVGDGGSMHWLLNRWLELTPDGERGADKVYGFDSFQGLPAAWEGLPAGALSRQGRVPFSHPRVDWRRGWFNATVPRFARELRRTGRRLSFLHLDCDLYESALEVLEGVAGVLAPEGCLAVLDEAFHGELRALRQAASKFGWALDVIGLVPVGPFAQLALRILPHGRVLSQASGGGHPAQNRARNATAFPRRACRRCTSALPNLFPVR